MAGVTSPRGGADYSTPTAGAENIREKNDQALPFPADSGGVHSFATVLATLRDMISPWEVSSALGHNLA